MLELKPKTRFLQFAPTRSTTWLLTVPLWTMLIAAPALSQEPNVTAPPVVVPNATNGTATNGTATNGTSVDGGVLAPGVAQGAVTTPEVPTGVGTFDPTAEPPAPAEPVPGLGDARLTQSENQPILGVIEAIALALRDNPSRREARFALEASQQRIGTAKSAGKLQANVSGDVSLRRGFGDAGTGNTGTGTGGNVNTGGNTFLGFDDNTSVGVSASLPVYNGGRVKASTRVAEANARAQASRVLQVDQELVLQVSLGYLDVLRSEQLVRVAQSNLDVSRERRRVAGVRFREGAAARLEVLRANTTLSDAQQRRISAVNNLGQSRASLNTLLGRSPETPLNLESVENLALRFGIGLPSGVGVSGSAIAGLPVPSGSTPIGGQTGITTIPGTPTGTGGTIVAPDLNAGRTSPTTGIGSGVGAVAPNVTSPGNTLPGAVGGNTAQNITPGTTIPNTTGVPNASTSTNANTAGTTSSPATGTIGGTAGGVSVPGVTSPGAGAGTIGTAPGTVSSGTVVTTPAGTGTGVGGDANANAAANIGQQAANLAGQSGAQLRTSAGAGRQSLAVTQAQIQAAEAAVEVARAQKRPQVDLSLTGFLNNPASFLGRFILGVGLGIAQNIADGGRVRSQVREAEALVKQLREGYAGQQLQVAQQIEQALLALDSANRRLASADVAVVSAAEALRAAQLGYEAGVQTNLEVSDAQTALVAAQTDAVNARFDVTQAQATLAASVGVVTPEARAAYQLAIAEEAARINAAPIGGAQTQTEQPRKRKRFLGIF